MQCHVASSYSWVFVFHNTVATCISCSLLPCDYLLASSPGHSHFFNDLRATLKSGCGLGTRLTTYYV